MNSGFFNGLHYSITANRHHPVILFLHGFMGSSSDWIFFSEYFSNKFCSIAVDLPGHGMSTGFDTDNTVWSFTGLTEQIMGLLNNLNIETCALYGYSLGGRVAMQLAVKYPSFFTHLILESANPGIEDDQERKERLKADRGLADKLKKDFKAFLEDWYKMPLFGDIDKSPDFGQLMTTRFTNIPHELATALLAFSPANQKPAWRQLTEFKKPLLLLCGADDLKYVEIMKRIHAQNKNSKIKIIEQAAHNVHFKFPERVAKHLEQFLSYGSQKIS